MAIEVKDQSKPPTIICPHCLAVNPLDLSHWTHDVTRIMTDKCLKCRGTIVVALLILADTDMMKVAQTVQAIAAMFNQNRLTQG